MRPDGTDCAQGRQAVDWRIAPAGKRAMSNVTYEILALRYGIFDGRMQFQNFMMPDDHAAPDPLDFFIFAIRGNGRTIVMDTGFNPASAKRRGREILRTPAAALRDAGIDPGEVPDVVLTH